MFCFQGLKNTKRGKFEGGDAHWEENKLNNYANSEIRLAEIQESLCHELSTGKDQVNTSVILYSFLTVLLLAVSFICGTI